MDKREEERILSLVDRIPELQELYAEHVELKRALDKLNHKVHLTTAEDLEKKRLQKVKLAGKDRMMALLQEYERRGAEKHTSA